MLRKEVLDQIPKYVHPFRITDGKGFQLKDFDPGDTRGLKLDKGEAAELISQGTEWLAEEQDMLSKIDGRYCWCFGRWTPWSTTHSSASSTCTSSFSRLAWRSLALRPAH